MMKIHPAPSTISHDTIMSSYQSKNNQDSAAEAQKKENIAVRVPAYRNEMYNDLEFYVYSLPGTKLEKTNPQGRHAERKIHAQSAKPVIRYPSQTSLGFTDHFNGDEADDRSISSESRNSTKNTSLTSPKMMSFASLRNLKPSTGNACIEKSPRKVIRFPSERSIVPHDDPISATTGPICRDIHLDQTVCRDNSYRSINPRGSNHTRVYQNPAPPSVPAMARVSHLDQKVIYRPEEPEFTYEPSMPLPPNGKRIVMSTSVKGKDVEANRVVIPKKTPAAVPSCVPDMDQQDKSFVRKQSSRNHFFDRFKPKSHLSLLNKQKIKQDSNMADNLRMTFPHHESPFHMMKSDRIKKSIPVETPKRLNKSSRDLTTEYQDRNTAIQLNRSKSHRHNDVSNPSTTGRKQQESRLMSKVEDIVATYNYPQPIKQVKALTTTSTPESSFTYPLSTSTSGASAILTDADSIVTKSFEKKSFENVHGHSKHRREHNERHIWKEKMEREYVQPEIDERSKSTGFSPPLPLVVPTVDSSLISEISRPEHNERHVWKEKMEREYAQTEIDVRAKSAGYSSPLPLPIVVPTVDHSLISDISIERSSSIFQEVQETKIEVYPGVCLPFRGIDDTKLAIMNDSIVPNQCPCCNETVFCITDVQYFLCHQCRVVSQNQQDNVNDDNMSVCSEAWNVKRNSSMRNNNNNSLGGTVGLGFTFEHFMELQKEIKSQVRW